MARKLLQSTLGKIAPKITAPIISLNLILDSCHDHAPLPSPILITATAPSFPTAVMAIILTTAPATIWYMPMDTVPTTSRTQPMRLPAKIMAAIPIAAPTTTWNMQMDIITTTSPTQIMHLPIIRGSKPGLHGILWATLHRCHLLLHLCSTV